MKTLNVVIIKPSKYGLDGFVERFWKGFMPNSSTGFFKSMIPGIIGDTKITTYSIDEYVHVNLKYLDLLDAREMGPTILLGVGAQSHQFQRMLDLAAYAHARGCMAVIGGPHVMTCDTKMLQGQGVSFALAEAEAVLSEILEDACKGELKPVYGENQRWATGILNTPVLIPPTSEDLARSVIPMMGIYPYRGCPFTCSFCSVIKIAGRKIRGQAIETTIASLRAAKAAGVKLIMITSDNFNKIPNVKELLNAMIEEDVCIPFFCQCDTQLGSQPELIELMARAKCFDIFLGVETFNRATLLAANKPQNRPEKYLEIVNSCHKVGIDTHFSNILGFLTDTESSIRENHATLVKINPDQVSFYVYCPLPGTPDYDKFMTEGLIAEENLDRFDTIYPVLKHPNLKSEDLTRLLMWSYKKFYTLSQSIGKLKYIRNKEEHRLIKESITTFGYTAFSRYSAATGKHPMSGGVWQKRIDHVSDYKRLRISTFGFELVPLPKSLKLSEADESFGKKIAV